MLLTIAKILLHGECLKRLIKILSWFHVKRTNAI